jgi:Ca2+-binding EF-hand superfamily protein
MDMMYMVSPSKHAKVLQLEQNIACIFERMDRNVSGDITRNELACFLGDLSDATREPRKFRANKMVLEHDTNKSHTLDCVEFRAMVVSKLTPTNLDTAVRRLQEIVDTPCKEWRHRDV